MSIVLPYVDEDSFITRGGEIISIKRSSHARFAQEYCYGPNYENIVHYCRDSDYFHEYKVLYGLDDDISKIDIFMSSKLNKKQLEMFKIWETKSTDCSEFLICVLGYDKISSFLRTVVTSCNNPHVRFFNYYLMDWKIHYEEPLIYDPDYNGFDLHPKFLLSESSEDKEAREKIEEIKSKVHRKDRKAFFR